LDEAPCFPAAAQMFMPGFEKTEHVLACSKGRFFYLLDCCSWQASGTKIYDISTHMVTLLSEDATEVMKP
jgi:hypothetical protein